MGDRLREDTPPWYVRSQPGQPNLASIPLGSLNRAPALIGWGTGGNVTICHVSSGSGEAGCKLKLLDSVYLLLQRDAR